MNNLHGYGCYTSDNQPLNFFSALLFLAIMMLVHSYQKKLSFDQWIANKKPVVRWSIYYSLVLLFILFGVFNRSEFIYFQF